jgi:hypothetical protein
MTEFFEDNYNWAIKSKTQFEECDFKNFQDFQEVSFRSCRRARPWQARVSGPAIASHVVQEESAVEWRQNPPGQTEEKIQKAM